ncbi:CHRD domain-containing protein [Sphingomonas sp. ASV193]|uniref:CHRD domain-containing protein n=1 Tax=Sphingomonas sp. ASV193 TaxID=3144405 RepID=UPI0032E8C940
MRITPKLLLAAGAFAALPAAAIAQPWGGRNLSANLRAGMETPPNNIAARGYATVKVNPGRDRACYNVSFSGLPRATMAHIHSGAMGVAGPPVVTLTRTGANRFSGCARIDRALARDLVRTPGRFYVNVHSAAFPNGAIRGQLRG